VSTLPAAVLAEVVLDDGRHVGVDQLFVANPLPTALEMTTLPARAALSRPASRARESGPGTHGVEVGVVDAR